jgi:hypothetical protein
LAEKDTQNPEDKGSEFDFQIIDNEVEKFKSDYSKFLIKKLELNDDRSDLEKNIKTKEIFEENPLPYYDEFQKEELNLHVEEIDFDEIEKQNKIFNEKLLLYFNMLLKVNIHKIKLTPEEINTLKQFLKDYYLSKSEIKKMLKYTDFKAAYSNVKEKIDKFLYLGLIENIKPHRQAYIADLKGGKIYYRLTLSGLFYVLKEIQLEDIGYSFMKPDLENRIFEVYKDDPLLQLFVHDDLIDMAVLSKIKSYDVRWIFVDYLKHICQEINKELVFFDDFQKNGVKSGEEIKWNRNLKDNKTEWIGFIDRLLGNVIFGTSVDNTNLESNDLIKEPYISNKYCSFSYNNSRYSIEIDTQKSAKLCINNEEFIKIYDPEKGEENTIKYDEIAVETKPHCFVLKRISREPENYLQSLTRRFLMPIHLLKTQLGYSILQLFPYMDCHHFNSILTEKQIQEHSEEKEELRNIASDLKIINLIDDFYKQINKKYQKFIQFRD